MSDHAVWLLYLIKWKPVSQSQTPGGTCQQWLGWALVVKGMSWIENQERKLKCSRKGRHSYIVREQKAERVGRVEAESTGWQETEAQTGCLVLGSRVNSARDPSAMIISGISSHLSWDESLVNWIQSSSLPIGRGREEWYITWSMPAYSLTKVTFISLMPW